MAVLSSRAHERRSARLYYLATKTAMLRRLIQSVFNLIVDIQVMVSWQLSKKVSTDQCHMVVSRAQKYNSLWWRVFLKLTADQLLVLTDRRLNNYFQCFILITLRRLYNKQLINFGRSVITGKSQTLALMYWPRYCSVNTSRPRCEISLSWSNGRG